MGKKTISKLIAVFVAAAMIFTCGISVFAASSPTTGKVTSVGSKGAGNLKTLTITWKADKKADSYKVKVGSKTYTAKGTSLKVKTKVGATYKITVTPVYGDKNGTAKSGKSRWMKTTSITKATSGKKKVTLKWKKVSGATKYQVLQYKNSKWTVVKTVKGTKATIKVAKKGSYKFKVRPVKGSYIGVRSAAKTGKAK